MALNGIASTVEEDKVELRLPRGVSEAHLHQANKPRVIGAIPSQTYGNGIAPMTQGL